MSSKDAALKHQAAREQYELKEKAIAYYKENGVPQKMEEILNTMFCDKPEDVYGHLATFFAQFIKPAVISMVASRQVLDGKGQPTIQTQVYCRIQNRDKLFSTCISPSPNSHLLDNAKMEDRETEDQRKAESVKTAINYINGEIASKLLDMKPTQQKEMDAIVTLYMQMLKEQEDSQKQAIMDEGPEEEVKPVVSVSPTKDAKDKKGGKTSPKATGKISKVNTVVVVPDEPRETFILGAELVCAVSQAVCVAGAAATNIPVYRHIANIFKPECTQLRMPLPMVTIMQSGKAAGGKQNCIKEFMIIPSTGLSYTQSLDYISGIYSYVEKALIGKGGVSQRNVNETGALCPTFDRPEQGLDLLLEAITAANLTPGVDIHIAINAAAHEMFEFERGKYEVITGSLKTSDELVDFWIELMSRYPAIILIIDPFRKQDRDSWLKLCDRITDHCFVAGNKIYPRPGLLNNMDVQDPMMAGVTTLSFENHTSLTDLCTFMNRMEVTGNKIILEARAGETPDDFLADLAVAMDVRFFKIGAPNRGERVSKYNRLLEIEMELDLTGMLAVQLNHEFKHIALLTEEEGEPVPAPASPITIKKDKEAEGKKDGKESKKK